MTTQQVPKSLNSTNETALQPPPQQLQPPTEVITPAKPKKTGKQLVWLLSGLVAVGAIATPTWYYLQQPKPKVAKTPNSLQLSGRVEGYETDIGAKIPGRVNFVFSIRLVAL